jgi:hypothetical protein
MKHLLLAAAHAAIVLSLAIPAELGRQRLPRAWAQVTPASPWNRLHGRYLTVNLAPVLEAGLSPRLDVVNQRTVSRPTPIALEARSGQLVARKAAASYVDLVRAEAREGAPPMIAQRIDCFLPSAPADVMPALKRGEIWVEVSVPREGPPRPLRLGVMKEGKIVALTDTR